MSDSLAVSPTEVLGCLQFLRTHLYAAQAQAVPGDDTIIMRHVYDAYKRVSDVCKEVELHGIAAAPLKVEPLRLEADRAWKEVDAIAKERDDHHRWRQKLADDLGIMEKVRDVLARTVNDQERELGLLRAVRDAAADLCDDAEEYECEALGLFAQHGSWEPLHDALDAVRPCTCHPDDNPPVPCPQKFALSECRAAAPAPALRGDETRADIAREAIRLFQQNRDRYGLNEVAATERTVSQYKDAERYPAAPAPDAAAPAQFSETEQQLWFKRGWDARAENHPAPPAFDAEEAMRLADKMLEATGWCVPDKADLPAIRDARAALRAYLEGKR